MNAKQKRTTVSIVRYEKPLESVRRAVDLSKGLDHLPKKANVFIKPNIVFWTKAVPFPKWGVITTSRVIEDMVILLKERGIDDITIGEGLVGYDQKDEETPAHAFEYLGYNVLNRKYGVKAVNVHSRPFEKVDLGDGVTLKFNSDMLQSDFVVDIPVLKTHAQTVVSLGIKNLKGVLDIDSRKKCHSADPGKDLHYMIAKLPQALPPNFTLLDGIFTNERGPSYDGKLKRFDVLVASSDMLSADMVGTRVLGYDVTDVPYLVHAAQNQGRPEDLSDIDIAGEKIEDVASRQQYDFPYVNDDTLPLPLKRMGIEGLYYPKYDLTMCTYCSGLNGAILSAVALAWKGKPWNEVEVLTGKKMKATPGKKKTILVGKCMYQANRDNPDIQEMIAIKGCPPEVDKIVEAFNRAGIPIEPSSFENMEKFPGYFMKKYEGKPGFDESFFQVPPN